MGQSGLKNIYIFATGGTIAGVGHSASTSEYRAGEIALWDLMKTIPSVEHIARVSGEQIFNVDSNELTTDHLIYLAARLDGLAQQGYDGFVITHGTDTLDETAFFLNLVLKTSKPVILTGAMRPSTAVSADGPINLYQAIVLAANEAAVGQGVLVVFSEGIYSGRDVQKANTFRVDAFNEKDFACLGYIQNERCYFFTRPVKRHTVNSEFSVHNGMAFPEVNVAYFSMGAEIGVLDYFAGSSQGVVIAGTGSGNFSNQWAVKIAELARKGIPVVRASRIGNGIITQNSLMDVSGNSIPGNTLPPQKAKLLLSLALTVTTDYQEIRRIFEEY